jgi:hypothetical protein
MCGVSDATYKELEMTQINATQMKQGDIIQFYGATFELGEVVGKVDRDADLVCAATGICINPSEAMVNNPYFYNALTGVYSWRFQGNKNATLVKVN